MSIETVKSASITLLDAILAGSPPGSRPASGRGFAGTLQHVSDYVPVFAASSIGSKFYFVGIPTNAKVKAVMFESEAMIAGKLDVGVWYGDDVANAENRGLVVDQDAFAALIDCASAVAKTDITNQAGNYPVSSATCLCGRPSA